MTTANVPSRFSKETGNSVKHFVNKGQLNKYRIRPAILNEHCEPSREIIDTVAAGNIVGQIFKASHDNINGILLTLESAAGVVFDDFESYADDSAIQTAWVASTARLAELEEIIVDPGGSTKSMKIPTTNLADEWIQTIAATDFTGYVGEFDFRQTNLYAQQKVSVFLGDGTNTKSFQIVIPANDEWFHFETPEDAYIEDQAGITDITAITKVGWRIEGTHPGSAYIDNIIALPPPGTVELKLFNLGSELPEDGVTSLDSGIQVELGDLGLNGGTTEPSKSLQLLGGKRLYTVKDFSAGVALEIPTNELMIPGNYYAISISHVDTDTNVYGPDSSFEKEYYNNGYAFSTPDESTAIAKAGDYKDCMFGVHSTQDVFVNTFIKFYDAEPGDGATEVVFIEDENMVIVNTIAGETQALQQLQAEFKDRVYYLPKGGKFEVYHNDNFVDDVTNITVLLGYIFEPENVNG